MPRGLMRESYSPMELATHQRTVYTLSNKEVARLGLREHELRSYGTNPARGVSLGPRARAREDQPRQQLTGPLVDPE